MSSSLRHPAIDAALSIAATLTGMEVVFIGGIDDSTFTFDRVLGEWPGLAEGLSSDRDDTLCHRMLAGAAPATADAAADADYADAPIRLRLGITSYVGVPIRAPDGTVVGTLCGADHSSVKVDDAAIGVLHELAAIVAAHFPAHAEPVVIRRTPDGWRVGDEGEPSDDLTTAMVLADLLQEDLSPGSRPQRPAEPLTETERLRLAVGQLEHALAARVTVEQAIGVIAERLDLPPRDAFERLRKVARRSGVRVHELSRDVVRSAIDRTIVLPDELTT